MVSEKKDVSNEKDYMKNLCLSQNQSIMETSAQLGGILVAILTFILAFSGTQPEMLIGLECQIILFSIAAAVISFFTATTFYLRGTDPLKEFDHIKYLNGKGDVFFAFGLLCLLTIPLLLFHVLQLHVAMILGGFFLLLAWTHLFFDRDKVGRIAIRLSFLGLTRLDCSEVHERARFTKSKWDWIFILLLYFLVIVTISIGFYSLLYS